MIKSQLIADLAAKMTNLSEKQINDVVNNILDIMRQTLENNGRIEIRGFGSFSLRYRAQRQAHNPKTGEKVITQPKYNVHFKTGKEMRDRVNTKKHNKIIEE